MASLFASAAAGAGLELAFGSFLRIILEVRRKNIMFGSTLQILIDTLETMSPSIKRIDSFNSDFDRPEEIQGLKDLIKQGEELVLKCSKVHKYNVVKKPYYTKKLMKLDERIRRYINTIMPLQQTADIKETLFEMRLLSTQIRDLSIGKTSSGGGSSSFFGKSNSSVGTWSSVGGSGSFFSKSSCTGVCSAPGLKVVPVGLEVPLKDLKEKLLKVDEVSKVIVVSAPGGCGKTTLAISLCQNAKIIDKYKDNIFFVTVSKSPNLLVIVQRLFQHLDSMVSDFLSEQDAVNQLENLFRSIASGPILLVLDDVWSGAESLVESLKFPIKDYKILVTSRYELSRFGSSYKLQTLTRTDAMALFCQLAFLPDENTYRPDQDIVNKIVEVCKGFPLAISVVGKSLCGKSAAEWNKRIKECSKATSILANCEVLNCLQSSVDALNDNSATKECYKDLGSFPEDQKIPATTLTDIWAELHKLDEDSAISSLYELSDRNLVDLVVTRKDASEDYGSVNVLQHDLLRELAIIQSNSTSIEQRKRLFIEISGNKPPEWWAGNRQLFIKASLLSICTDEMFSSSWGSMEATEVEVLVLNFQAKNYTLPFFMSGMDKLKVLIVANYSISPAELSNFQIIGSLYNLKRIRFEKISIPSFFLTSLQLPNLEKISLVMCNIGLAFRNSAIWMPNLIEINIDYCDDLEELPDGFCNLIRLQKLSITNCHKLKALPEEIGNLMNLEMLRLNSCIELLELPESIGKLQNLCILDVSDCLSITELPEQIGELSNLNKLYMIDCSSCVLPWSAVNLVRLKVVIADEETANLWKEFLTFLPNLEIKVHKDINLNWLR
ncbi:probable disease resistance protein At5g66900 isoform X2 [Mercurialis annua]|uniref:probable disease resistance protein At5g66900 isoform X2 n=1 Tax=Mercurialis annua TaxID=3986 RepID=UPI00215EC0DB|nr:probable disease resistance protein At5g66900 isoform X2 [Mercurialis annua]